MSLTVFEPDSEAVSGVDTARAPQIAQFSEGPEDFWLDPYLRCRHPLATERVRQIRALLEGSQEPRRRATQVRHIQTRKAAVEALVANLAFAAIVGASPRDIAVSLQAAKAKTGRYSPKGIVPLISVGRAVGEVSTAHLTVRPSRERRVASSFRVAPGFALDVRAAGVRVEDFRLIPGAELVCLTRREVDYAARTESRDWIEYVDTPATRRFRRDMERINEALDTVHVTLIDAGPGDPVRRPLALRRMFVADAGEGQRFDLGGRLFGGWWQNLSRDRRGALRINGEPVADLDWSNMFLRLAYLELGLQPPDGDLYANVPGLPADPWRPGLKILANAMLSRKTPMRRLPERAAALLPQGLKAQQARQMMFAAHPPLGDAFERGLGSRLMFRESQTLMAALLRLAKAKVPALAMHDGLMVPASAAGTAAEAMREASHQVLGSALPIQVKSVS